MNLEGMTVDELREQRERCYRNMRWYGLVVGALTTAAKYMHDMEDIDAVLSRREGEMEKGARTNERAE